MSNEECRICTKLAPEIMAMRPGGDYGDIEPFMDCAEAYYFLSKALYTRAKCKETNKTLNQVLDEDKQELNCPPVKVAEQLDDADRDQIMSDDVFWFLEKAYFDAAKCIDYKYWYALARLYYYDRYGHVDLEKAVFCLKTAVEHIDGQAEVLLGKCYLNGEGISQDYEKAYHLLVKGALLDFSGEAIYLLGDMYLNGWYVAQDKSQAYNMYLRAYRLLHKDEDYLQADSLCRIAEYKLNEIGTYDEVIDALYCYQQAELRYYDQKKHHIRGAEDAINRCLLGQKLVREKLEELSKKMEDPFYDEG